MNFSHQQLLDAASEGSFKNLPDEVLTEENLLTPNAEGWTPFHAAAMNGHLDKLPRKFLTEKNLLFVGCYWTPLHMAARSGHLDQVPRELLTSRNLLARDHHGRTALHDAVGGRIEQVPREILTEENLRTADRFGWTIFHEAAATRHLDRLPAHLVTFENLRLGSEQRSTPGDRINFILLVRVYVNKGTAPPPGLIDYARFAADDCDSAAEFVTVANLLSARDKLRRNNP